MSTTVTANLEQAFLSLVKATIVSIPYFVAFS